MSFIEIYISLSKLYNSYITVNLLLLYINWKASFYLRDISNAKCIPTDVSMYKLWLHDIKFTILLFL